MMDKFQKRMIVTGSCTASSKTCSVESVFMCSLLYFQIRDWLTLEEDMLRQQAVVVGDVDDILQVLDKQKVRLSIVSLRASGSISTVQLTGSRSCEMSSNFAT